MDWNQMPTAFGLALAQHPKAREQFKSLTDAQKEDVIRQAQSISSKREMWSFVSSLAQA